MKYNFPESNVLLLAWEFLITVLFLTQQQCQENNKILSPVFAQNCTDPLCGTWGHSCSRQPWQKNTLNNTCPCCISASLFLSPFTLMCLTICSTQRIPALRHSNKDAVLRLEKTYISTVQSPGGLLWIYFFFVWEQFIDSTRLFYLIRSKWLGDEIWQTLATYTSNQHLARTILCICWMLNRQLPGKGR